MKAPKIISVCQGCGENKKARFRVLVDQYLCEACYRNPTEVALATDGRLRRPGAQKGGAAERGETEFDLRHLPQ